jgi:hypothetical protein
MHAPQNARWVILSVWESNYNAIKLIATNAIFLTNHFEIIYE